jgi:ADP-ribose pyrophosphatase
MNTIESWKTISSEYISKHHYFTARRDVCEANDKKIIDPYFVVEMSASVCGFALTENNEVLLVRQYRYPINEVLLEIPGGFIDHNEEPAKAIEREMLEETGYAFKEVVSVGKIAANPGVLNNYTYLYLLKGGVKIAHQQLDANEQIEVVLMPLEKVKEMLCNNQFKQALHVVCMYQALLHLKELEF